MSKSRILLIGYGPTAECALASLLPRHSVVAGMGEREIMKLKDKHILVTGGAGFIGSHIIELLLEEGCAEVVAIDNLVRGNRDNLAGALTSGRVRLIEADIRDTALMGELVGGFKFHNEHPPHFVP
jgi:FlaA1/EpsC-like NDP-sugar epimerase